MGSEKTECAGCLETFNGTKAFDAHRIAGGVHRRCLTPIEMRQAGFVRGKWDRWSSPQDADSDPPMRPRTVATARTA